MKIFDYIFLGSFLFLSAGISSDHNRDIAEIRAGRKATNEAIANHDLVTLGKYWMDDMVLVRGNSTHVTGKENILSDWQKLFTDNPKVNYVRITGEIKISDNDSLAWETGRWIAEHSYSKGGNYSAMWKKSAGAWKIQAELFVSLH